MPGTWQAPSWSSFSLKLPFQRDPVLYPSTQYSVNILFFVYYLCSMKTGNLSYLLLLFARHPAQCLIQRRYSINLCWMVRKAVIFIFLPPARKVRCCAKAEGRGGICTRVPTTYLSWMVNSYEVFCNQQIGIPLVLVSSFRLYLSVGSPKAASLV